MQQVALPPSTSTGSTTQLLLTSAARYWRNVTRGVRIAGSGADAEALDTTFPWLAHDAMIHLTVPHGLEQYTGAAWGTRDVCQGPVEFLLALEHDQPVRQILRDRFRATVRGAWGLAAMVHARALLGHPGQA